MSDTPKLLTPDDPGDRLRTATPDDLYHEPRILTGTTGHDKLRAYWQTAAPRPEGTPPPRRDNNVVANLGRAHAVKLAAAQERLRARALDAWGERQDGSTMKALATKYGISHNKLVSLWRAAGLPYDRNSARKSKLGGESL